MFLFSPSFALLMVLEERKDERLQASSIYCVFGLPLLLPLSNKIPTLILREQKGGQEEKSHTICVPTPLHLISIRASQRTQKI